MPKVKKVVSESTLTHLRRKPDNYVGPNTITTKDVFLVQDEKIVRKTIDDWNEPLIHCFKELIDNAADNIAREWAKPQSYIKIDVNEKGIKVTNDGMPIPVRQEIVELPNEITKKTEKHKLWRTQALFNYFRTGTNSGNGDDDAAIGTNGIGTKAVLGLSKYAKISHGDPDSGKQLEIEYKNSMDEISEPKIKAYRPKSSFTTFYYEPDFEWFNKNPNKDENGKIIGEISKISENHIGIMHAMSISLAYITGCRVVFNGKTTKINTLKKLGETYFGERKSMELTNSNGDKVLIMEQSLQEMEEYGIRQLSFVNGTMTRLGGIHVNSNANLIGKVLAEAYGSPLKEIDAKKFFIYIVNYTIKGDVEWNGQTKSALKSTKKRLQRIDVAKKDFTKCKKWKLWDEISIFLDGKTNRDANKGVKNTGNGYIGPLGKNGNDAFYAGNKDLEKRKKCELYIAEGHSAKSLIDVGANYRGGNDYIGVLAIRGKINNVKKMKRSDQKDKKFLALIRKLMGLQMGCKYETQKECDTLRYGRLIVAADKDLDGYHIRALLYCFIETEHFGLIENGIVTFLETPVIKTNLGKQVHRFYLREDFEDWLETLDSNKKTKAIKNREFIKGLGGNDGPNDAKFIFKDNFFTGKLLFKKAKDRDYMEMFLGGDRVDEKKKFMYETFYNKEWIHLPKKGDMTFSDFIEHIYTLTIDEQVRRAVPCVYDGLIESKKEIVWTALKFLKEKNGTENFSGTVWKESAYDHGPQNIPPTVIKMTQNIVGKNNMPIFVGHGIFGNRYQHTEDNHGAAAPRYTKVSLQPIMSTIFRKDDDPILEYKSKDGVISSPEHFLPIIPFFAVNGESAPANTWSTKCPAYNPEDLVAWVRWWISENFKGSPTYPVVEMVPWYRGFKGTVEKSKTGWVTKGSYEEVDKNTWKINEIAAGCWGVQLQIALEKMADEKRIEKPRVFNLDSNTINAIVKRKGTSGISIEKNLKSVLEHGISMSNVTFIHADGPQTRNNIEDHLDEYCRGRYEGYRKRRKYKIKQLESDIKAKQEKIRYIYLVLDGTINFKKIKDREHLIEILEEHKFYEINGWDYICNMTHLTTSKRSIERLEKEVENVKKLLEYYKGSKPWKIWLDELEEFEVEYSKYLKQNPMNQKFETFKPKGKKK
jgi:DNA topoisomerase II